MGKLATVVYDAVRHVPVIVRTRTSSPAERFGVIDAVAAFANHCESLHGIARSQVHVSALWGGPPFITYQVVKARYRVMVLWVDAPGDFDTAHDVQDALVRLYGAVTEVVDGMMKGDAASIAYAYRIAGAVLDDDYVYSLQGPAPQQKKSSIAGVALGGSPKRSGTASGQKKGGLFRSLFGGKRSEDGGSKISESDVPDSNALSVLSVDSTPFDDQPESLADISLPDEVFAFSDFGAPLSEQAGDLSWVARLIQGIEKPKSRPPAPVFRPPLESKSSEVGPPSLETESAGAFKQIGSSSTLGAKGPVLVTPESLPLNPAGSVSEIEPPSRSPSMLSYAPSGDAPEPSSAIPPSYPQGIPAGMPGPPPGTAPVAMSPPVQPMSPPSVTSGAGLSVGSQNIVVQNLEVQPAPALSSTHPGMSEVPPLQRVASHPVSQAAYSVPEQLRQQEDDFDVSALGTVRDPAAAHSAASSGVSSSGGASLPPDVAKAVRSRMNAFANTMQNGNYPLALQQVTATLQGLSSMQPRPEREIVTCASYFLALKVLIRVRVLEAEVSRLQANSPPAVQRNLELALLTMFLAETKHLLPRHSIAGKKMAVERNVAAGNFGMAARWLRTLIEAAPVPQKGPFRERLQICVRNHELNTRMPASKWLCYNSLVVIPQKPIKCVFCPAVFSPVSGGVTPGQDCPVCYTAKLTIHST